jgi:hypothetical protein
VNLDHTLGFTICDRRTRQTVRSFLPLLTLAAVGCGTTAGSATVEEDRAAIQAIYEQTRAAHFHQDAEAFLAAVDSGYWSVSGGRASFRNKTEARADLQGYLAATTFEAVDDVRPPIITISADGTTAWLVGVVEVRARQRDSAGPHRLAFQSAWVDIYEKHAGRWRLVVRANTQLER